jgi:hypothetical protein
VVVYASLATSAWTWRSGPRALLGSLRPRARQAT